MCEKPAAMLCYGEAHAEWNCGRPPAKSQQGTEALSPTAHMELNPANDHVNELGNRVSLN